MWQFDGQKCNFWFVAAACSGAATVYWIFLLYIGQIYCTSTLFVYISILICPFFYDKIWPQNIQWIRNLGKKEKRNLINVQVAMGFQLFHEIELDLVSNVTRMIFDVFIIGAAQVPGSKVRISLQPQDSSKGDRTCIQQTDCATSPDALCVYNECTDNLCHSTELW